MTYSTFLLPLDDDTRAEIRLDQAIALARRFGARLVGQSSHRHAPWSGITQDALTRELELHLARARERERHFAHRCDAAHFGAFALEIDDDEASRAIVRRAQGADLVILGQPDPIDARHTMRREVVEDVVLRNARPTLLLPYAGHVQQIGRTVLVGWDDSHGAARAIADALPFLGRADAVHVVRFDASAKETGPIAQAGLEPVLRWLASHGVKADGSVRYAQADAGNALLSYAADVDADLLVMGGWGHARWSERLLGGATRTVLDSMTLPVLVSH